MPSTRLEQDAQMFGLRESALPFSIIGSPQQMQMLGFTHFRSRLESGPIAGPYPPLRFKPGSHQPSPRFTEASNSAIVKGQFFCGISKGGAGDSDRGCAGRFGPDLRSKSGLRTITFSKHPSNSNEEQLLTYIAIFNSIRLCKSKV
jgi:hypothetical protein